MEPRRFYDGGTLPTAAGPGEPPDPGSDPRIVLERHSEEGVETFALERRLAYRDRHLGELLVPADADFRTDLTSVPALFTWLVPKTGAHLPAALLHDALVAGRGDPASYVSTEGHEVDRVEADRVFRDAMADTGTGVIRRWIVWSAVTVATIFVGRAVPWSPLKHWSYRVAAGVTIAAIVYLGYSATGDLFDVSWVGAVDVPWMGDRPWWAELAGGFAGAIVLPLALSLLWGRLRMAGAIAGVMLAVLLHVTVGLAVIGASYLALERLARRSPVAAWVLAGARRRRLAGRLRGAQPRLRPISASQRAAKVSRGRSCGDEGETLARRQHDQARAPRRSPPCRGRCAGTGCGTVRTRCHPPTRPAVTTAETMLAKAAPSTVPRRFRWPMRIADVAAAVAPATSCGRLRSRKGWRSVRFGRVDGGVRHLAKGVGDRASPVRRPGAADRCPT